MWPGRILLQCVALVALAFPAAAAPDEDVLGKASGYPIGERASWFFDESVRVGSFAKEPLAAERDAVWRGLIGGYFSRQVMSLRSPGSDRAASIFA